MFLLSAHIMRPFRTLSEFGRFGVTLASAVLFEKCAQRELP